MHDTCIIVNGRARSGKNTSVEFIREILAEKKTATYEKSTIDPIIDLLNSVGIDTSAKTDADRKLLADVGNSLEEYNNYRSIKTFERIKKFHNLDPTKGSVSFTYTREARVMETLKKLCSDNGIRCLTLFVVNPRVESKMTNEADAEVENYYEYDYRLMNDSGLDMLRKRCYDYVTYLERV